MKVEFLTIFTRNYIQRYSNEKKIQEIFSKKLKLFINNPKNSILHDHPLKGKLEGYRSFSITKDIRVVYYIHGTIAYFIDIGTHNQVYK